MCNDVWRFILDQRWVKAVWAFVLQVWQFCGDQFWLWRFFCSLLAVFVTLFAIGVTVVIEVAAFLALSLCETWCVILNVIDRSGPNHMCFDYTQHQPDQTTQTPPPTPALTVSAGGPYKGNIYEPLSMHATTNQPLGAGNTISWELGDGTKASGADISHVYAAPLVFTVTVSVLGQTYVGIGPIASDSTTARIVAKGSVPPPPAIG